jgi:hypothetical protein
LLVELGLGEDPPSVIWPIRVASEPDSPDNHITVFDTLGVTRGRTNPNGEVQLRHGFQIRVRSATHEVGYAKLNNIAIELDTVYQHVITIDASRYLVHAITQRGDIIPLGKEVPLAKRNLFTLNGFISVREL